MKKILIVLALMAHVSSFAADRTIVLVNYEINGVKQWNPGTIIVKAGEEVELELRNVAKGPHGFMIPAFGITKVIKANETQKITLKADKKGLYEMKCHMHKAHVGGQLLVL